MSGPVGTTVGHLGPHTSNSPLVTCREATDTTNVSPRVTSSQTTVTTSDHQEDSPDSTGVSSSSCMPPPKPPGPISSAERKDSNLSSSSSSTSTSPSPSPNKWEPMRPANQVRSVMLTGVPIVALVIDCKERLCLAQISNTLLKDFSYNEIHNRRVALGITCVQCTPVQLEILRRAGAMPVSSRRCGMITKREAERLCKSFLTENAPPKLPDNFAFDVKHECAWGCRGSFVPSRYNSSRAKCIKCTYCNLFFSPNKFIFHSHRLPESKYVQPDAANFNSWRRHLKLYGEPPDEYTHAWEDVKAMFNGGSRKRVMAASVSRYHMLKRPRIPDQPAPPRTSQSQIPQPVALTATSGTPSSIVPSKPTPSNYLPMMPYQAPKPFHIPGSPSTSSGPFLTRSQHPTPTSQPPHIAPHLPTNHQPSTLGQPSQAILQQQSPFPPTLPQPERPPPTDRGLADYVWAAGVGMGKHPNSIPTAASAYGFFWARGPGPVPVPGEHLLPDSSQPPSLTCSDFGLSLGFRLSSSEETLEPQVGSVGSIEWPNRPHSASDSDMEDCSVQAPPRVFATSEALIPPGKDTGRRGDSRYFSAFKPVFRTEVTARHMAPHTRHAIETLLRPSPERKDAKDCGVSSPPAEPVLVLPDNSEVRSSSAVDDSQLDVEDEDEDVEDAEDGEQVDVDVETTDEDDKANGHHQHQLEYVAEKHHQDVEMSPTPATLPPTTTEEPRDLRCKRRSSLDSPDAEATPTFECTDYQTETADKEADSIDLDSKRIAQLSKKELEDTLLRESQARKRAEKQFEIMKGSFQEQVKREVSYREEISKQLDLMRETLCSELDQERKARYAVLQKLKEAHDALHHFSCKVLMPRQCSDCTYRPILPQ